MQWIANSECSYVTILTIVFQTVLNLNLVPSDSNKLYTILRSVNSSAMSICGLLPEVPVLLKRRALCRLLAAWVKDGGMQVASDVFFSLQEHRRTSLTSPSIFLEKMVGNTALIRSSTLFLKAKLRHTRFSMNMPDPTAGRWRQKRAERIEIKHGTVLKFFSKKLNSLLSAYSCVVSTTNMHIYCPSLIQRFQIYCTFGG